MTPVLAQAREQLPRRRPRLDVHARPSARRGSRAPAGRRAPARAPSRCRSPPDRRRYARPRRRPAARRSASSSSASRGSAWNRPWSRATSRAVIRGSIPPPPWSISPTRARWSRAARAGSTPRTRTVALVGAPIALEDLDRRRLAGAVRPEQGERSRRRRPGTRGPVDDGPAAVALDEAVDLDRGRAVRRRPRSPPPAISAYCRSKSASVSSPIWIERRIPSAVDEVALRPGDDAVRLP